MDDRFTEFADTRLLRLHADDDCLVVVRPLRAGEKVLVSAISPVAKICANPDTYRRMSDDMDVDAGRILLGQSSLDEVGEEIFNLVLRTVSGEPTRSEDLGHQEFQLGYKVFRALEPSCLA